jgi:hypothetical protein
MVIPGGAYLGNMRASAALYEPLRSDPQIVMTFNVSAILNLAC